MNTTRYWNIRNKRIVSFILAIFIFGVALFDCSAIFLNLGPLPPQFDPSETMAGFSAFNDSEMTSILTTHPEIQGSGENANDPIRFDGITFSEQVWIKNLSFYLVFERCIFDQSLLLIDMGDVQVLNCQFNSAFLLLQNVSSFFLHENLFSGQNANLGIKTSQNFTVQENYFLNFELGGLNLENSSDFLITQNEFRKGYGPVLSLLTCQTGDIVENTFKFVTTVGIEFSSSFKITVSQNEFFSVRQNSFFYDNMQYSANNLIQGNRIIFENYILRTWQIRMVVMYIGAAWWLILAFEQIYRKTQKSLK